MFDSIEGDEIHLELFQDVFEYIIGGEKPTDLEYLFQGLSYFGHETLLQELFKECREISILKDLEIHKNKLVEFFDQHVDKIDWDNLCLNENMNVEFFVNLYYFNC